MKKGKPAAAFDSQRRAEENIRTKLEFLTDLVRSRQLGGLHAVDQRAQTILTFPRSIRQFNLWDTSLGPDFNPGGTTVNRNSHETLRKNPDLASAVTRILDALKIDARGGAESTNAGNDRSLKRRLRQSEELRSILEAERIENQRSLSKLKIQNASLIRKVSSLTEALANHIEKQRNTESLSQVIVPPRKPGDLL